MGFARIPILHLLNTRLPLRARKGNSGESHYGVGRDRSFPRELAALVHQILPITENSDFPLPPRCPLCGDPRELTGMRAKTGHEQQHYD